jgi:exopolysaccharide production protein ExoQ
MSQRDRTLLLAFLSAISLCSIALVGSIGVMLFIATSGALAVSNLRGNLVTLSRLSFLFVFPLLAILSTGWSDAPQLTMRTALQLTLTVAFSVLIAGNLPARRLVMALFVGSLALCASALPNLPRALQAGVPLASSFLGSKNSLGFAAFLLFATSLTIVFDRGQRAAARLIALVSVPIALLFAYLSRSGGGGVSILIISFLFPVFASLTLLKPRGRLILSSVGILAFGAALLFHQDVQQSISTFRSEVLERNETLTGRTSLWGIAGKLWNERPLLGHGYAAFWRHGNLDAEALWRSFGIKARGGFNFHNVFVETKVELGIVGLTILLMTLCAVGALMIWRQLRAPSVTGAFLLSAFCVLIIRSTIENGLVSAFSLVTLIWIAGAVYSLPTEANADRTIVRRRHDPRRGWRAPSVGKY